MRAKAHADPLDRATHHGMTSDQVWARCQRYQVDHIVQAAADECRVTPGEVCSASRTHRVSKARAVAWGKLRAHGWSLMEIAALFDRDHSSVSHGLRRLAERAARGAKG
jgi:chromosomal replication initiation ATPase DnaA